MIEFNAATNLRNKTMNPEIDINKPITVTESSHGPDYIELNLSLVDGQLLKIPMLLPTAKGIGLTLTTIADRLIHQRGGDITDFEVKDVNLN